MLSSVEGGYDLLAPKFDYTPYRTPDRLLDATTSALRRLGPFGRGLDVCCGTGAGLRVLRPLCPGAVTGVDFSAGMLEQARRAHPGAGWVRADGPRFSTGSTGRCDPAGCSPSRSARSRR